MIAWLAKCGEFEKNEQKLPGLFKVSSPFSLSIWYNKGTKTEGVREADAVEVSADKPTVDL